MQFIDTLLDIMKERNISGYQLEKDTGIKQATLGKWKKGSLPTIDKLMILLNYFQVSADELLGLGQKSTLTENEKELLELFQKLPDREQIKFIGRLEEAVNNMTSQYRELESSDSKIG